MNTAKNSESAEELHILALNGKRALVTVEINGQEIQLQVDSGADSNILPTHLYKQLTKDHGLKRLGGDRPVLVVYNGDRVKALGQCQLMLYRKAKYKLTFTVVDLRSMPILGLESSMRMSILKINCDTYKSNVSSLLVDNKAEILDLYTGVFNGLGKLSGKYKIRLKEAAVPVIHASRRIPVALRGKV